MQLHEATQTSVVGNYCPCDGKNTYVSFVSMAWFSPSKEH